MPPLPRRRGRAAAAVLVGLGALTGCGGPDGPVTLTVLAASSLTEVLAELGAVYRHDRPQARVEARFGGSQEMAAELADPGPGDVLVTADAASMNAVRKRLTGPRRTVASTTLTIAVQPGNPRRLKGPSDLSRPGLRVAVGAPMVPVGRYARQVFAKAGVTVRWDTEEISARAVLDRVRSGQADAGLVYITDMRSAGAAASSVAIPAAENVTASYPAAVVKGGHEEEAGLFVSWLASPAAAAVFRKHGFTAPAASPR
ncbi:molybdate ABC transporter substrate-binding protein [Actinomadura parmotrematis]|uniref:Molybdate ABC transporter substrate-binding protein n=1 Tax=Actinomadura parmotrematis TaxID=2864039 RepID=A0ABS7FUK5_9ACTN|nr:molybdate ABC transporter substrate-binding protein [Actinomadura parmotrematis]MBW8483645.1 molybdate ABC transporter substrate-binding protein [Actinomadura parmotrematis]